MSNVDTCPYCENEIDVTDVCSLSDGDIEEGCAVCPHCNKAIVFNTRILVVFDVRTVESKFQLAKECFEITGHNIYRRSQERFGKLLAYNAKIDEGVHTDEEIEQYKNEWWGQ